MVKVGTDDGELLDEEKENVVLAFGGDDTIKMRNRNDYVIAGGGDDDARGLGGGDSLFGEDGFDSLDGGEDNDHLDGGLGRDYLSGDGGDDTLIGGGGNDAPTEATPEIFPWQVIDPATDEVRDLIDPATDEVRNPMGGLFAGAGNDVISGGEGWDWLEGDSGNDAVLAGEGDDTLRGGDDNDVLFGGAGNDWVWGEQGDDTLDGGNGGDVVDGGTGDDQLTGGDGDDLFWFAGNYGDDWILDFTKGADHIGIDVADPNSPNAVTISVLGDDTKISFAGTTIEVEDAVGLSAADILLY